MLFGVCERSPSNDQGCATSSHRIRQAFVDAVSGSCTEGSLLAERGIVRVKDTQSIKQNCWLPSILVEESQISIRLFLSAGDLKRVRDGRILLPRLVCSLLHLC